MSEFRILCYQSKFAELRNPACEYISEMPAAEQDQFATVMALGADGAIDFDKTREGRDTVSSLISKFYRVDLRNMSIQPPQENYSGHMPRILFRAKSCGFEELLEEHVTYERNLKKYLVLSRHRHADKPRKSRLSGILQDSRLSITDKESFRKFPDQCSERNGAIRCGTPPSSRLRRKFLP